MKTGRDRVWRENVEELKNRIQIGDVLTYRKIAKVKNDPRLLVKVRIKVRVKAKFSHLVWVEEREGKEYPIKTLTYTEILIDTIQKDREKRKRLEEKGCLISLGSLIPVRN